VVKSLTSHFSTITDRLYPCSKLLIYTDVELNYFGEGISKLTLAFDDLIKQKKAYTSGVKNGLFGIRSEGIYSFGNITKAINLIINLINKEYV